MDSEEDAEELVTAIKNCDGMTTLRLEANTIGINAAKAIAKVLESKPEFKRALWKDMFTQRKENEIPEALRYLSSGIALADARLVELDLSDNAFGPRGICGIVNLLRSPPCHSLQKLRLNNNGLGIMGGKMLAESLTLCLSNSKLGNSPLSLKVFVCGRNSLENDGATALSQILSKIGTLEVIAMPQNGICHPGISALAEAFGENPLLKEINLEDNNFTEKGAVAISKCLPLLENLEVINFEDCLIRTDGAKAIAEVIKDNCPKLKNLHLGYNEIGKKGGILIAEAMENKQHLKVLDLNGNQFGSEGCQIVESAMEIINKSERLLSLGDDEGADDEDDLDYEDEEEEDDDDEYEDYNEDKVNERQVSLDSDKSNLFKEVGDENKVLVSEEPLNKKKESVANLCSDLNGLKI